MLLVFHLIIFPVAKLVFMEKIINKEINMDFLKMISCIVGTFALGFAINYLVAKWQAMPIKEEVSTPIYITKEINNE